MRVPQRLVWRYHWPSIFWLLYSEEGTAVGGVVGLLLFMGVKLNPFAVDREDPYMVRIPINSRPIEAYSRVDREDMLNPATGGLMFQGVPPQTAVGMQLVGISSDATPVDGRVESVRNDNDTVVFLVGGKDVPQSQVSELGGALMNINSIIGRVVRKDKRAGMAFRDGTFFPQGTPEGIAGATPPGMRAVTLDATKLTGVHALNAGDRIDLMASVPTGSRPRTLIRSKRLPKTSGRATAAARCFEWSAWKTCVLNPPWTRTRSRPTTVAS